MIKYIVCVANKVGTLSYVLVMACCTKCEPFLSTSSRHFVQLVHKGFAEGSRSKKMEEAFSQQMLCVALFGGVLMKSQISLVSQREVESMKKLMLLSVLQKSLQVWVWEWIKVW